MARARRRAEWLGEKVGGALGAGLLAIPGVLAGGNVGRWLAREGCLGARVGLAMATAVGASLGGEAGAALGPLVGVGLRRLAVARRGRGEA